eukprot:scaffold4266_cov139-Skeletonema_menzelii.AAC.9
MTNSMKLLVSLLLTVSLKGVASFSCTETTSARSTSTSKKRDALRPTNTTVDRALHTLNLFSLPPKDDNYKLPGEALVRECWRWKDSKLGDGRDYFVPKPKALKAYQSLFLGMVIDVVYIDNNDDYSPVEVILSMPSSDSTVRLPIYSKFNTLFDHSETCSCTFEVVECVALSNCARFETIFILEEQQQQTNIYQRQNITQFTDIAGRYLTAYRLHQQVSSQRTKTSSLLERAGLTSWLDLPEAVDTQSNLDSNLSDKQCSEIINLAQRLLSMDGALKISSHLSLISGGLAPRPNRPDREVIFRPYSSRDAHILLQLKRTVEVISVADGEEDGLESGKRSINSRGRIKTLLDGALSAGKAARNEDIVPEIKQLKEYGSDGTPPRGVADVVAQAAIEKAIQPSVESCVARLTAMETADDITQLRQRVNEIASSIIQDSKDGANIAKMANELLHQPTILLREGKLPRSEIESVVKSIENELRSRLS